MAGDMLRGIFEEVRARPYGVSVRVGEAANNCFFKNKELLERLGVLGLGVRGVVGEMDWAATPLPRALVALEDKTHVSTHFWLQVWDGAGWRDVDASMHPAMAQHGWTVGSWEGGEVCFGIPNAIRWRSKWLM